MSAARELYVYWKTADLAAALRAVRITQQRLCAAEPTLIARVLERDGTIPATVMEVYAHPQGVDAALQTRIDRALSDATQALRLGDRHTEAFIPR